MGINQQHAGAGDGPTTFITVSPFAGGGDLITLIYLLALFRFLCSFRAGYRKPVCGSRCQSRVDARHSGRTHAHSLTAGIGADSRFHAYRDDQQYAGNGLNSPLTTVLALLACGFACFIEMGKIPFDVAEAEQELQEGPLTEYSGAGLALAKWGWG